jgi:hypothetical protein
MPREDHDLEIHPRCPTLGGEVPFRHCRTVNHDVPCQRLLGCWHAQLDVLSFLRANYTVAELEPLFQPSKSRLQIMFETLEKANS